MLTTVWPMIQIRFPFNLEVSESVAAWRLLIETVWPRFLTYMAWEDEAEPDRDRNVLFPS